MPELPEVETVRCQLAGSITGLTFDAVEQVEPFMLRDATEEGLRHALPGRRVVEVRRLGKFIIVPLSGEERPHLTLHLGMTGHLLVSPADGRRAGRTQRVTPAGLPPHIHTRYLFRLRAASGVLKYLEFRDARKFGRVHLTFGGPAPRLAGLGPDAWLGEWDAGYLADRLGGRTAPLKAFLLDQRHLAGIGNIYADEILWWARLSPVRPAGSLDKEEVQRLAEEIRRRLGEGVRRLGCSTSDFVDTQGRPGRFQEVLRAYRKQGQACSRCGETLVRTIVAGRGTAYCPRCQV